jgi:recombination protein RecA
MGRKKSIEQSKKQQELDDIASHFKSFLPAREVLTRVRAVPTIFPQFDHATGVGGLPIDRYMLIHGKSNNGKTVFAHGLIYSFLKRGHFALFIDAEFTTPITWIRQLMGEYVEDSKFFALRPRTYEETVDKVREFAETIAKMRSTGVVPPDTTGIIVLDSLRKLVPQNLMKKISEGTEKGGVDGMGGRAAQVKAAMNAAWLDELIPLLATTGTALLAIARESEDVNASAYDKAWGKDWKIGGGKSIVYDASLVMRCEQVGYVYKNDTRTEGETAQSIGERIRVSISKTKVAPKEGKVQYSYFHISNGALYPVGFDRARDVLELAENFGVISKSGAWYQYGSHKWQGRAQAVQGLYDDPLLFAEVEEVVRSKFSEVEPMEQNEEGYVDI